MHREDTEAISKIQCETSKHRRLRAGESFVSLIYHVDTDFTSFNAVFSGLGRYPFMFLNRSPLVQKLCL